jgi:cystathionine gamma-synthase
MPSEVISLAEAFRRRWATRTREPTGHLQVLLFSSYRYAKRCHEFMRQREDENPQGVSNHKLTEVDMFGICWNGHVFENKWNFGGSYQRDSCVEECRLKRRSDWRVPLYAVCYPDHLLSAAKEYWQHTGFGISSRRALYWLRHSVFCFEQSAPSYWRPEVESDDRLPHDADFRLALESLAVRIADGHSTVGLKVSKSDVYTFPSGMAAITALADSVKTLGAGETQHTPSVAAFGSVLS